MKMPRYFKITEIDEEAESEISVGLECFDYAG